jgi:hypothetical protein
MLAGHNLIGHWPGMAILTVVGLAVHLITGVAANAGHAPLAEVDIGPHIFPLAQIFVPDAAAVAGGTGARHGRGALKFMPAQETAAHV